MKTTFYKSGTRLRALFAGVCAVLIAQFALTSCNEDDMPFLVLDNETIVVGADVTKQTVDVKANSSWVATSNADWCEVLNGSGSYKGQFEFVTEANTTALERTATITVKSNDCKVTLLVRQSALDASLTLATNAVAFGKDADTYTMSVVSNHDWTLISSSKWCTTSVKSGSKSGSFDIAVTDNDTDNERTATITVVTEAGGKYQTQTVKVVQSVNSATLVLSPADAVLTNAAGSVDLSIVTNAAWKLNSSSDWCTLETTSGQGNAVVKVSAAANTTGQQRVAVITARTDDAGVALVREFRLTQGADSYLLSVLADQYAVGKNATTLNVEYLVSGTGLVVKSSSNADWITTSTIDDHSATFNVAENTTGKARQATVTLYTSNQNGDPIICPVTVAQSATENVLDVLVSEITLASAGESVRVPLQINTEVAVRSSIDWCKATVEDQDVVISAERNLTEETREAYVTVSTASESGDKISKSIRVTQDPMEVKFEFSTELVEFESNANSMQVGLTATGEWRLASDLTATKWLTVTPNQGEENAVISLAVAENKTSKDRSIPLLFESLLTGKSLTLNVVQHGNATLIGANYVYLGRGYDISGEYAHDNYVKASVLDWEKLAADDHIADVTSASSTVEKTIEGSTVEDYVKNYAANASVDGRYMGFSGSVKANFSLKTYGSAENQFATFRHVTKKQIVKIYEDEKPADLMDCRSDIFIADIEKAKQNSDKTEAAKSLVEKYGSHVVMGFSLGGALDFSMSADRNSVSSEINWGVALQAGYKTAAYGINAAVDYQQYNSLATSSSNFEAKLVARGGESQYASNNTVTSGGSESMYSAWLTSLEDSEKWVMVDYEGSQLQPLWSFIDDATLAAAVQSYVTKIFAEVDIEQSATTRRLLMQIPKIYVCDEDAGGESEWHFNISGTLGDVKRTLCVIEGSDYLKTPEKGDYNFPNWPGFESVISNLSIYKPHVWTFPKDSFKVLELDGSSASDVFELKNDITLTFDPSTNRWAINDGSGNTYGDGDLFPVTAYYVKNTESSIHYVTFYIKLYWWSE